VEPELALEAAVPEEMIIDASVDDREAQARDQQVFDLFAYEFSIGFFGFHVRSLT